MQEGDTRGCVATHHQDAMAAQAPVDTYKTAIGLLFGGSSYKESDVKLVLDAALKKLPANLFLQLLQHMRDVVNKRDANSNCKDYVNATIRSYTVRCMLQEDVVDAVVASPPPAYAVDENVPVSDKASAPPAEISTPTKPRQDNVL